MIPRMSPSPKALQSQARWLCEIVAALRAAVAAGHPADAHLARLLKAHREFGSRDRRLFSNAAFAWFRWRGWIEACTDDLPLQIALALLLDGRPAAPALPAAEHLLDQARARNPALLVPDWLPRHVPPGCLVPLVMAWSAAWMAGSSACATVNGAANASITASAKRESV